MRWWVRDNAGHAKTAWKTYEMGKKGLIFKNDVDKYGTIIKGKHKGGIGKFIPKKQLRF